MIRAIAVQYCGRGDVAEHLVVIGFAGILDALDVYTPAVGVNVQTFIEVSVRNAIRAEAARLTAAK